MDNWSIQLGIIIGTTVVCSALALFLRGLLYKYLSQWAKKTKTQWDNILIKSTRTASIIWCIWLGIFAGLIALHILIQLPRYWEEGLAQIIPVIFVALGIYTVIRFIMGTFRWFKVEVCSKTKSRLDDIVMSVLIVGTPIIGGGLGLILILKMLGKESESVNNWLTTHGVALAFLVVLAVALLLLTIQVVPRLVYSVVRNSKAEQTEDELTKRADTLITVIVTSLQVIIIFIFFLMILSELGTDIVAILTGASVLGVALAFGAQSLVKDIIAGLFIIMENQYRKGDVVKIADISGLVEEINLRRTILRDLDGITHIVPNGEIKVASNFTKIWSRVNMNVNVAYDTDIDHAIGIINRVGKELAEDPLWAPSILTPPKVLRLDNLGSSGIEIKILGETKPIKQWEVMGELRLRLKRAFDKEGIEMSWPHVKVFFGNLTESIWPRNGEEKTTYNN